MESEKSGFTNKMSKFGGKCKLKIKIPTHILRDHL